jgi:hypothetical protein
LHLSSVSWLYPPVARVRAQRARRQASERVAVGRGELAGGVDELQVVVVQLGPS